MDEWADRPISAEETAVIEQNAVALGVSIDALMENAGRAVAEEAVRHLPRAPARVAIVAGPGNNGGDGSCAAYHLGQWGYSPEIWMLRPPEEIRGASARRCFDRLRSHVPVHTGLPLAADLGNFPLLLDAMLGTGQSGPLRSPYREAVAAIHESGVLVLAIDVPTGLGQPEGLRAQFTVALNTVKTGMDPAQCGEITVRDIGIPRESWSSTGPGEFRFYPTASERGSRGRNGRVLVIGGGPYSGAPALAALAAIRSGAERGTVIAPRPSSDRIQSFSPDLVVLGIGEEHFERQDASTILAWLERSHVQAVIIGMGAGDDASTNAAFSEIIASLEGKVPLVVDADAIHAIDGPARTKAERDPHEIVATPNQGEFKNILQGKVDGTLEERKRSVRSRADAGRFTLLVKGEMDLISDGGPVMANRHPDSAMSVGGMGDVLAGLTGGLLAQGLGPIAACRLATYWATEAANRVSQVKGYGLIASDILEELPSALVAGVRRVRMPG
jgi:hydroxyethylthiazole kinase-like uncharacterized protein yjeF